MKLFSLITLLLSGFVTSTSGQVALNQLDSAGKKHGKWIVYLDEAWKKTKDSTKASFMRYTWFDHGTNLYPMGSCGGKNYKLVTASHAAGIMAPSILLDGEYKWYDAKGRLSSVHVLKNGEYISCKEYYCSGELHQYFDYTKPCKGERLGWTLYIYNKKGEKVLVSPLCKDRKGRWPTTRG